jgi:hypothetical protein
MKDGNPNGSSEIRPSPELNIEGNIQQLVSSSDTLRQVENREVEVSASAIETMLRRVREASSRDDLQQLHKKLQNDGSRIRNDVEYYAEFNQLVMQLTKIVGENVKNLPSAPGIVPQAD